MVKQVDSRIPEGPVAEKWTNYKAHQRLVNPKNKLKLDVIVVGTGLAGASAAATLGEMGFNVLNFCIQDSPRRAHSIAAQGGINAAKNYQNDGDFVVKTPPVAVQLLEMAKIKGGSGEPNRKKVAQLTWDQIRTIAQDKMVDLNCFTVESAMTMVAGTARSMGITVKGEFPGNN